MLTQGLNVRGGQVAFELNPRRGELVAVVIDERTVFVMLLASGRVFAALQVQATVQAATEAAETVGVRVLRAEDLFVELDSASTEEL